MKNKQLTFGALISYVTILFNIASGLIYIPWMIRTIGDDQYALYTLALSVINIFLLDFGIGSAVTKFLSNYYAKGEQEQADRFMGIVYKTFFIISGVIAAALFIFYFFINRIYVKLSADEITVFKRLFIIVAVYSILSFPFTTFNGILIANERFIELKLCSLCEKILNVILIVVFLLLGSRVYALVLVNAFSNFLFLGIKFLVIRKKTRQRTDFHHGDRATTKHLLTFSVWITVMNLARRCIYNIMPSVIAATIGSREVTLFSLAATIEGYVFTFTDAINGMFMPRISKIMVSENTGDRLQSLMTKVAKFHIYTIGLMIIGFVCVGLHFMNCWMGAGYDMVYWCTILLIIPSLFETPQQVARTSLLVKDVVRSQAILYIAMAALNLGLAFLLLPMVGIIGAAISVCSAYLLKVVGLNVLYKRHLPISLKKYFKDAYGRWIFTAVLSLAAGVAVNRFIALGGWLGLIVKVVIITAIYGVLLVLFCMNSVERKAAVNKISGAWKKLTSKEK